MFFSLTGHDGRWIMANLRVRAARGQSYSHDIEPVRALLGVCLHEIRLQRLDELPLLGSRDCFLRLAHRYAAACLDLDANDLAIALGNQIELAAGAPPVSFENCIAALLKPCGGQNFAMPANSPTSPSRRCSALLRIARHALLLCTLIRCAGLKVAPGGVTVNLAHSVALSQAPPGSHERRACGVYAIGGCGSAFGGSACGGSACGGSAEG